ncbi:aminopeptidase N [Nonomuraea sp. NPDC050643]|uniref:aminopeptidase N n=1 Tax=Nonomuraea sp. NPDC050643 TaxID=3155660 RepID=UPI0033FFD034
MTAVPGENLTRAETVERAGLLTVHGYDVALDLTTGPETFRSETTVRFAAAEGASTFIDAIVRTLRSVVLNGAELDPAEVGDGTRIRLDGLAAENELRVVAEAAYSRSCEGLHRFVDPVDDEVYLFTQFEAAEARRVFAVFEQPDLKASFRFTVTAPAHWTVISNAPAPGPVPTHEGASTWSFAPTARISSYLTEVAAGPYEAARAELTSRDGRVIPLGLFARRSLFGHVDAGYLVEKTRQGFAYFEERFGPYPFEKYDQIFAPEFPASGMENAGAVVLSESFVFRARVPEVTRERRVKVLLHELSHMWFGDLVTMRWWNDLWLKESFAEWASSMACAEATEWDNAWTSYATAAKAWAYQQDQLPSTHPIVADIGDLEDVKTAFDGITYAKGASVLKQLVAWVGLEAFLAGVSRYLERHAGGNTELPDLLSALEEASGRDLGDWARLWLSTAGVNTLRTELETAADGTITSCAVVQSAPPEHPALRPHRLAIGLYAWREGALVRRHRVELDVTGERTDVAELRGLPRPDLLLLNDDDLAYAKIRLDDRSSAVAAQSLSAIEDPLARALVWGALWDATRDGEIPARDFLRIAPAHLAAESESATASTVLEQLLHTAHLYARDPAKALRDTADALWDLAVTPGAGQDRRLQLVTAFAQVAEHSSHVDDLAALLDGRLRLLDGPVIDVELEWELLTALVAAGRADADAVRARLREDSTATGRQRAARALAAVPTPQAKATAWASMVEDPAISGVILRETARGFLRTVEPGLLEPYVPRYFELIEQVWATRSFGIARRVAADLYPFALTGRSLLEATDAWLATADAPAALRRILVENRAAVARALAARTRDG